MLFVFKGETSTTSIAPETNTDITSNTTIVTSTEADTTTDDAMSSSTTMESSNSTDAVTTTGKTCKQFNLEENLLQGFRDTSIGFSSLRLIHLFICSELLELF